MEYLLVHVQHFLKVFYARCIGHVDSAWTSPGSLIVVISKELPISMVELFNLLNHMGLVVFKASAKDEVAVTHTLSVGPINVHRAVADSNLFLDIFDLGGVEGLLLLVNQVQSLHKYCHSLIG